MTQDSSANFAVLSEHRRWRFFAFFALYVAQGISFGLVLMAIPAFLAAEGVSPGNIAGFTTVALLPHAIKLINAPVMDRWSFLPMGKRRPWVLFAQAALVLALVALTQIPDPTGNLPLLTACCFAINFFTAFQDVATDGMAVDLLPFEDQPRASGIMFGGATLSGAGFAAATGWTLSAWGIPGTAMVCAAAVLLISTIPLMSRERPGERFLPWTRGAAFPGTEPPADSLRKVFANLRRHALGRASIVLAIAIVVYGLTRGIHLALMPTFFVQELGWTDTAFSSVSGIALLVGGGTAMLFAGFLQDVFGRRRLFSLACALLAVFAILVVVVPGVEASKPIMSSYRIAYNTLDTLIATVYISIGMAISNRAVAATQFAIYMALSNVGYSMGSALFGRLQGALSYAELFLVFAGITASCILIMRFLVIDARRLGSAEPAVEAAGGG